MNRRLLLCYGFCFAFIILAALAFPRFARDFQNSYWGLNAAHYHRLMARLPKSMQEQLQQLGLEEHHGPAPPQVLPGTGRVAPLTTVTATSLRSDTVIRYTLDGSIPHERSPRWTQDLVVTTSMVVRARAFVRGQAPSPPVTRVYAAGIEPDLPVLALTLDPVHLTDRRVGILANPMEKGRQWERLALLSAIPAGGDHLMECEVKIRVHGGASRRGVRKRLRMQTPPDLAPERNELLKIVPASKTTHTWVLHVPMLITQIYRERLGSRIAQRMNLATPPATPCILLVNGQFWGIYDLMPRVDENLFGRFTPGPVTLLSGALAHPVAVTGDSKSWDQLHQFIQVNDLQDDAAFLQIAALIDLDNLIDCWVYYIFAADGDRPHNNMILFRHPAQDTRWQFLVYDSDLGFDYEGRYLHHDTLAWHLRDQPRPDLKHFGRPDTWSEVRSTLLFRKLMAREDFRLRFWNRFEHHLSNSLAPENTLPIFDGLLREMQNVRELELAAFPALNPTDARLRRQLEIERIRHFLEQRPDVMRRLVANDMGDVKGMASEETLAGKARDR